MRYRQVHEGLFSDPKFTKAPPDMRWIMVSLLISPHGNMIGCFRLPKSYIAEDTGYPIDRVSEGFQYCIETRFIDYCDATGWVLIRDFLRDNPVRGPKQAAAANKHLANIPRECSFFNELAGVFEGAFEGVEVPEPYPIDRVSMGLARARAGEPEPEPEPIKTRSANADSSSGDDASDRDGDPQDQNLVVLEGAVDESRRPPAAGQHDPPSEALRVWRAVVGDALPLPQKLTPARRTKLRLRLQDTFGNDLDRWRAFCAQIRGSPHLTGENDRGWRASLDWCLEPRNMTKILEGNYDDRQSNGSGSALGGGQRGRGGIIAAGEATKEFFRRRSHGR